MEPRREAILKALEKVIDPELKRNVVELDMVRDVRIEGWRDNADVFAYFNNDWSAYAVKNALWLRERLCAGR